MNTAGVLLDLDKLKGVFKVSPPRSGSEKAASALQEITVGPRKKNKEEQTEKEFAVKMTRDSLPIRVHEFDKLISRGGVKRGDTILLSGGCGTGKTTFGMQSLYNAVMHGEKGVYLTLEESPNKIRENMEENFGWKISKYEREGRLAIIKLDPLEIARAVEATIAQMRGGLYIDYEQFSLSLRFKMPFNPDRVVVDSLSALSIAFMENKEGYRQYLRLLFDTLETYNSVNIVLGETEQEPGIYSRTGIEEFLSDGVVVLYNLHVGNKRMKAMEILKLRSSNHVKRIVPYEITSTGIKLHLQGEVSSELTK